MAGDPDNLVPTYAQLTGVGAPLLASTATKRGQVVTAAISDQEQLTTIPGEDPAASSATVLVGYDAPTQHNVPGVFVDYRNQAGLPTIGYAISEPFYALVAVGGAPRNVMIQAFERRVLTYTSKNPLAFRVEMGNVGQQYYRWRYPTGLPLTVPTTPTTGTGENPTQAAQRLFPGYTVKDVTVHDLGGDGGQQATVRLEQGDVPNRNAIAAVLVQQGGAWTLAFRTAADANAIVEIGGYPKTATHPGYVTLMYHLCGANCNSGEHTVLRYDGNGAFTTVLNGVDDRGSLRNNAQGTQVTLTGPVYRTQDPRCCPTYTFTRTWQWQGTALAPQDFAYQPTASTPALPPWLTSATFVTVALQPFLQVMPDAAAISPLFASSVAITNLNGQRCTASRAEVGAAVAKIATPPMNLWQAANNIDFDASLSLKTSGGTPVSAPAGTCTLGGSGVGGYVLTVTVAQSGFLITEMQAVSQLAKAVPDSAIQLPGVWGAAGSPAPTPRQ